MIIQKPENIKIDAAKKKIITQDWLREFPSMGLRRNTVWGRRVGPLLISMGYEVRTEWRMGQSMSCYDIQARYYNFSNFRAETCATLPFTPTFPNSHLGFDKHEKGLYKEVAEELRQKAPIPLEGRLMLSQVLKGYENALGKYVCDDREFQDPALITAWAGKVDLAREVAIKFFVLWENFWEKYAKNRDPVFITEPMVASNPPPRLAALLEKLHNPKQLQVLVDQEVIRHKLTKIPYEDLIIDM